MKNSTWFWTMLTILIILLIIFCGLIYTWQKSALTVQEAIFKAQLNNLQEDINNLQTQVQTCCTAAAKPAPVNTAPATQTVDLYYHNPQQNKTAAANDVCSPDTIAAVKREIPITATIIQDTIKLLLQAQLSAAEISQGFDTEFPDPGFNFKTANLQAGILTLEFTDTNNFSSGGSCRVGLLRAQIEKTALQFPEVKQVVIRPDTLFQP